MDQTKDFLRNVISKIQGSDPSEIKFTDLRERKKRKTKTTVREEENGDITISNSEGVILDDAGARSVSWSDIPKGGKKRRIRDNLEEWTTHDFYYYAMDLYGKKFMSEWNLRLGGAVTALTKVRDRLLDYVGFNSNLVLRDYIKFFFDHYASELRKEKKDFYFQLLLYNYILQDFANSYDYRASHMVYMKARREKTTKPDEVKLTFEEMERSYQLSLHTLLCNFGIVLGLNWLIHVEGIDKYEAAESVMNACEELSEKKLLDIVKSATEFFSPYPTWFVFRKPDEFITKISPDIRINVTFANVDKNKFEFFNKRSKNAT